MDRGDALIGFDRFEIQSWTFDDPTHLHAVGKDPLDLFKSPACGCLSDTVVGVFRFWLPRALPLIQCVRSDLAEADELVPVSPRSDLLRRSLVFAMGMLVFRVALTPDCGEPTLKRVSDSDLTQLLSLLKLFQLSE